MVTDRLTLRVTVAFVFFVVAEYGVWIGMLVYAYQHGGATAAGLVAVVQLLPGVFLAPLVAGVADRRSPTTLLMGGYLVQALGMAGVAVAIWAGASPLVAYVFAVVSTTAMCVIRPAHFTLLPAVARDAQQLTAVNLIAGWGESGGMGRRRRTGVTLPRSGPCGSSVRRNRRPGADLSPARRTSESAWDSGC
ncbi:MAG TPA: hypothetical protein VLX59_00260 [Acidimicrobiales bacterium]|nr:hypothetical protein [Acidimicrobiales bacterium]